MVRYQSFCLSLLLCLCVQSCTRSVVRNDVYFHVDIDEHSFQEIAQHNGSKPTSPFALQEDWFAADAMLYVFDGYSHNSQEVHWGENILHMRLEMGRHYRVVLRGGTKGKPVVDKEFGTVLMTEHQPYRYTLNILAQDGQYIHLQQ